LKEKVASCSEGKDVKLVRDWDQFEESDAAKHKEKKNAKEANTV